MNVPPGGEVPCDYVHLPADLEGDEGDEGREAYEGSIPREEGGVGYGRVGRTTLSHEFEVTRAEDTEVRHQSGGNIGQGMKSEIG